MIYDNEDDNKPSVVKSGSSRVNFLPALWLKGRLDGWGGRFISSTSFSPHSRLLRPSKFIRMLPTSAENFGFHSPSASRLRLTATHTDLNPRSLPIKQKRNRDGVTGLDVRCFIAHFLLISAFEVWF